MLKCLMKKTLIVLLLLKKSKKQAIHFKIDLSVLLIEITPKNSTFNVRVFFDKERNILQRYIDICKSTGFDSVENAPYYDDLFLDIIIGKTGDVRVLDEDELEEALDGGVITKDEFDFAVNLKDELLEEIAKKSNKYIELNTEKYM